MVLETILLLSGGAVSFCYWYFWNTKYRNLERNIINFHTQIPPRYQDIPLRNTTPAPPYQESITPPPPIDPPQY